MRFVYVVLTYLVAPFVIAVDAWRAMRQPAYRGRVGQRLGFVPRRRQPGCLWVHAVSVGEVQAAAALIRALQAREPSVEIVVTTVTPTGAQRARELFKDRVAHCYLPYDLPGATRRFLDRVQPRVAIFLETEIWPTLYREIGRRRIPLVIASARLSAKSVERYGRMPSLLADTLSGEVLVGAQTELDAGRFRAIGADPHRVQVTGNVKFDLEIPASAVQAGAALRAQWGGTRPVWVAGSTHEGEEAAALDAHEQVRQRHPSALLVLVPRHPQRFDAVIALLRRRGTRFAQRSAGQVPRAEDAVLLVDTLGELQMFYAAADVAFVGGSLVPVGGHSLLEPAVLGLPIVSGPHTHNAPDVAKQLRECGAVRIVSDARSLGGQLVEDFSDPAAARAIGARGRECVAQSRGAVDRLVAMIAPLVSRPASAPVSAASSAGSGSR